LRRFDHETFTYKEISLELPVFEDYTEYVISDYFGDELYLVAKSDVKKNLSYAIVTINSDGKVLNKMELKPHLSGEVGSYYSKKNTDNYGFVDDIDNAAKDGDKTQYVFLKKNHPFRSDQQSSLRGAISIDKAHNAIYIYGFYEKDNKIFLQKYDNDGKMVWETSFKPKRSDENFITTSLFVNKLYLNVLNDNTICLQDFDETFSVDGQGKLISKIEFKEPDNCVATYTEGFHAVPFWKLHYTEEQVPGLNKYLQSQEFGKVYHCFVMDKANEVVIATQPNSYNSTKMTFLHFKKNK
jgi:hypothetical protein